MANNRKSNATVTWKPLFCVFGPDTLVKVGAKVTARSGKGNERQVTIGAIVGDPIDQYGQTFVYGVPVREDDDEATEAA